MSDDDDQSHRFATFERNWRRVASTHTLQDLLDADKPPARPHEPRVKVIALGMLLVLAGVCILAVGLFSMMAGTLLPSSENPIINAIQNDDYYHLLVPLTVPVTIAAYEALQTQFIDPS